ncbi:MAG TPA: choline-sulfatase [Dongiaceae bacterium]
MAAPEKTGPNILFVMFDQMAALSLALYGKGKARTPHLEALARRGTLFENAYCNAPLCSPSRFAMMTGCLPSHIGAYDNAAEFPADRPTFAHHLRASGYRTCLSGKMDFAGADQLHGYEERLTTDLSPSDFGWTPDWDRPETVQPWYHTLQSVAEAGPCDYSLNMEYDEDACFKASQWLHRHVGSGDPRPFMLTCSFMHPHDPYQAPRRFWDLYADMPEDPPADWGRAPAERDIFGRRMHRLYDRGEIPVDRGQVMRARRAYYAMLSYADDLLGRLLGTVQALGLTENTVVIVTSDHGDMLGERGLWYKMVCFERALRVPLLFAGPGIPNGARRSELVSHVDLLPTLVDIAGQERKPHVDGRGFQAALQGGPAESREVVAEFMGEGYDAPVVMIRRENWKFIHSEADGSFLYDLQKDPRELDNLAQNPLGESLLAEVKRRWDLEALREAVLTSQRRRHLLHTALTKGRIAPWDFEPRTDAAQAYYRNYSAAQPDPDRALRLPRGL